MKTKQSGQISSGFTIVEVLIVLAIAGLILLIIFIAVPALQRNSRNISREQAVGLTASALEQFNSLHGHYPRGGAEGSIFKNSNPEVSDRFNLEFYDFSGSHAYMPEFDTIAIEYGHWCNRYGNGSNDTDPLAGDDRNANLYVIWTRTETGNPESVYCVDNWDRQSNL